jgi:hypothetical protein
MYCTLLGKNEMGMSWREGEHIGIKDYQKWDILLAVYDLHYIFNS